VSWSTAEGTTATVRVGLTAVLCFEGPGAAAAAAQARGAMALRDRGELLAQLGGDVGGEARQEALLALSAVAPATHDEEIAAALVAATKHPEPSVRWEALRAAGSTGWRELLPRIEEMATDDPDAHIRKLAGGIAELMEG
jgi:HEAT repeat protein